MPARVTRGALVAHIGIRCRTSQYCRTFGPLSVSPWNDLNDPLVDVEGLEGYTSRSFMPSCWSNLLFLFVSYYVIFFFLPRVGCAGLGSSN